MIYNLTDTEIHTSLQYNTIMSRDDPEKSGVPAVLIVLKMHKFTISEMLSLCKLFCGIEGLFVSFCLAYFSILL